MITAFYDHTRKFLSVTLFLLVAYQSLSLFALNDFTAALGWLLSISAALTGALLALLTFRQRRGWHLDIWALLISASTHGFFLATDITSTAGTVLSWIAVLASISGATIATALHSDEQGSRPVNRM